MSKISFWPPSLKGPLLDNYDMKKGVSWKKKKKVDLPETGWSQSITSSSECILAPDSYY